MTLVKERPTSEQSPEREISLEVQRAMMKHPGKWVAITRSRLISVADTPTEALQKARAAGTPSPILSHVPEQGTTYFF